MSLFMEKIVQVAWHLRDLLPNYSVLQPLLSANGKIVKYRSELLLA